MQGPRSLLSHCARALHPAAPMTKGGAPTMAAEADPAGGGGWWKEAGEGGGGRPGTLDFGLKLGQSTPLLRALASSSLCGRTTARVIILPVTPGGVLRTKQQMCKPLAQSPVQGRLGRQRPHTAASQATLPGLLLLQPTLGVPATGVHTGNPTEAQEEKPCGIEGPGGSPSASAPP